LTVKASQTNAIAGLNENLVLKYVDSDGVHFDLLKDQSGKIYHLTFDIRNYFSYQGGGYIYYGSYSGAYLFRPSDYIQDSVQYTILRNVTTYNGGFVQEMFLNFTGDSIYRNTSACLRLRYYDESIESDWEVYLAGLPNDK
jgi:hypothetical protein